MKNYIDIELFYSVGECPSVVNSVKSIENALKNIESDISFNRVFVDSIKKAHEFNITELPLIRINGIDIKSSEISEEICPHCTKLFSVETKCNSHFSDSEEDLTEYLTEEIKRISENSLWEEKSRGPKEFKVPDNICRMIVFNSQVRRGCSCQGDGCSGCSKGCNK